MDRTRNGHRLSIGKFLEQDGRTLEVIFGKKHATALYVAGCEVEPDGTCHMAAPRFCELPG